MKILILARSLGRGGAERQVSQLASSLVAIGEEVTVALFYEGGVFEPTLRIRSVPMAHLKKKGPWDFLGAFRRFVAVVRALRPDVVYSFMLGPNIFAALGKPFFGGAKVVWAIRTSDLDWGVYGRGAAIAARVEAMLARVPDLVICNSYAGRVTCLRRGFPENKLMVVPNGIDTTVFYPDEEARYRTRKTWAVDDHHILVGLVGRLDPHKRHRLFLDAMREVIEKIPTARPVCVGDGADPYARDLRRYAVSKLDSAAPLWIGSQENMRGVYNAIDVLVLCSSVEGFPNVLAEAMACGTPVVTTPAGDAAQILNDETRVVRSADPTKLAEAIIRCARRSKVEIGRLQRERILTHYSLENSTMQFLRPLSQWQ